MTDLRITRKINMSLLICLFLSRWLRWRGESIVVIIDYLFSFCQRIAGWLIGQLIGQSQWLPRCGIRQREDLRSGRLAGRIFHFAWLLILCITSLLGLRIAWWCFSPG